MFVMAYDPEQETSVRRAAVPDGAPDGEMERLAARLRDNVLFDAVAGWLDGHVVVLDAQRRIVAADAGFAASLGRDHRDAVLGSRLGEAYSCVFHRRGGGGCGDASACHFCGALEAILAVDLAGDRVGGGCRMTVRGAGGPRVVYFDLRVLPIEVGGRELKVVWLRRPAEGDPDEGGDRGLGGRIAGYALERKIGEGAMGSVYLVRDERGGRFALKILRPERACEPAASHRFEREVSLSTALDHPHIVRTLDVGRAHGGRLYMVSEYCAQGSAADWLQRMGPLPLDLALYWMTSIAHAVAYAWETHGLVHRDIKPGNLLIDDRGQIKLADFGIARSLRSRLARLTQEGKTLGSVYTMPPEQAEGIADLDVRSDLYAIGATFYRLLSGAYPVEGDEPMGVLLSKVRRPSTSIARWRSTLPDGLVELLDAMLERDRDARPQDAQEVARRLMELTAAEGVDLSRIHHMYHLPEV